MKGWACVARMGGIGDDLVAASVLRPLKKLGYMTEVITSEMAHVVFQNNPYLDKLTVKADGDIPGPGGGDDWQKWFVTRAKEYDLFVHLSHSMEVRHAIFPGATSFWWPPEVRRELCAGNYLETAHKIAGLTPPFDFGPLFFRTEEEITRADKIKRDIIGGPYLAWVIAGSRIDKIYPYSAQAIARIIKELKIPVVLFGNGGKQFENGKAIMEHVGRINSVKKHVSNIGPDGLHLADDLHMAMTKDGSDPGGILDWPIRRSLSQMLSADIMVTPDTGSAWAAAFEPIAKIVMVSHASAENITKHWINTVTLEADKNRVPCHPCHRLHSDPSSCVKAKDVPINAAACMADISVETIVQNVERLWRRNNVVALREAAE